MVFASHVFLFLFLPLFLAVYYLLPTRYRSLWIIIGSYAFFGWWRVDFLFLLAAVTAWNYLIGGAIGRETGRAGPQSPAARRWVWLGVGGDLAVLGYFKYANFGIDSFNSVIAGLGATPIDFAHVILPIGISFYIFQSISYLVDVYRGDTKPAPSFVDFAAFLALFPQLIAGPVLRYKDLADQFTARTHTVDKFAEGSIRFMQGFIKKVFIADTIAPLADQAFALQNPSMADAWLGVLAYTAQLYFDFSGYSDMAIGLGLMMGFRFIENFRQPYIAQSITEFWRRWHISLSTWLRDYLYVPLGGNRHGTFNTYRNLLLTMLLGGLWHGAAWTFVLWGAWHGALLAIERALGVRAERAHFHPLPWMLTLLLVMLGWVVFRAPSMDQAMVMYAAMFSFDGAGFSELYAGGIQSMELAVLALAFALILGNGLRHGKTPDPQAPVMAHGAAHGATLVSWRSALLVTLLLPLFAISVLKLSAQSYSPFLYFQF